MAYNNAIPQPADQLSTSQPQILDNFIEIAAALAVNHGAFNGANEGKHMFVELPTVPNAQLAVVPAMLANEIGLVSQVSVYSGAPEMQVIRPGGNATVEFTSGGFAATGWTRLPSGILLKWGTIPLNAQAIQYFYPVAANIPVFANVFSITATLGTTNGAAINNALSVYLNTTLSVHFISNSFSATTYVNYLTIGN
jgi:hypothetical protein